MFAFEASRGLPFELSSHALAKSDRAQLFPSSANLRHVHDATVIKIHNTIRLPETGPGSPVINFGFAVQVAFDLVSNDCHFQVVPLAT